MPHTRVITTAPSTQLPLASRDREALHFCGPHAQTNMALPPLCAVRLVM